MSVVPTTATAAPTGPIEDRAWPARLSARVVSPDDPPRIHGFDVQGDLARHYRFGEVLLVALTGEAPDDETGRAFEAALTFAAPAPVHEGPAHAAMLARLCGSRTSSVVAVAAMTLAEQVRTMLDEHEPLLPRLLGGSSLDGVDARFASRSENERDAVARLRVLLGSFCERVPPIAYDLRLDTAIIAVMIACGLRHREQVEAAFCVARLGVVCAEAFATDAGNLRSYPMDLPRFVYRGGGDRHDD